VGKSPVPGSINLDDEASKESRQVRKRNLEFASRLRDALGDREQAPIARNIGVGKSAFGEWLKGSMPAGDKLLALADELGVQARWLGSGEGPRRETAEDEDWVVLPRYDLDEFTEYGKPAPEEWTSVRRDWLGRRGATPVGLWLTTMPAGAPEIAAEGDTLLCQDAAVRPVDGSVYVVMLAGRPRAAARLGASRMIFSAQLVEQFTKEARSGPTPLRRWAARMLLASSAAFTILVGVEVIVAIMKLSAAVHGQN